MSDPLPAILLIAGIVTIAALVEVLILHISVRISLSFHTGETETKGVLSVSWFIFGLEMLVYGKDPQLSVTLGRARLLTRPLSSLMAPGKEKATGPEPGKVPGIIASLPGLQGPALAAITGLFRCTRFDFIRGTARIGLGDPCATGMLYGLYRAVLPFLPVNRVRLTVVPEFNREVCEVDITTRFRVMYPLLVLAKVVKIVKHPASRKVMKSMRTKNPGETAA